MGKQATRASASKRKTLSHEEREQYLLGHIPYRLQTLRLCHTVCGHNLKPHPIWDSELRISWAASLDHNDMLNNPIIESGLVYCRVFLEFLGIKRDNKTGKLIEVANPQPDDVFITDFGLPQLAIKQAINGFSYASSTEVEAAILNVIENANKSVAHLTSGPQLPTTYASLKLACKVVSDLVHRCVYGQLGEACLIPPIDS